ncbi:universal stress protein [Aerococcus christensenii]|uniref:Universal stress protein n=1 Tax=Aerococcus christensenii TaxID=87541 RepID=A0A120I8X4_9LACT|nr:universal stress protein [Aerococcus christensenii]AMB93131.1 hypothetical protein AWM71_07560 [Aerococcus christensenii]KXB33742.1 universal stress family protein [Aerococcus christensenii]MDK8234167.1 universal stress protein [Aerococcus christensenii]PKY91429.1 universal stress protein [Aerococcus christensenii]WEB70292.1 universal stress protein [Aerococcus christensenii]
MSNLCKKILVPIDGSDQAKKAFEEAVHFALTQNSELTILTVVADYLRYDFGELNLRSKYQNSTAYEELLRQYQLFAQQAGVKEVSLKIKQGDPRKEILNVAKEEKSDLIIMGSTGKGMIDRLLIGSVSEFIMNHSSCDVLITK